MTDSTQGGSPYLGVTPPPLPGRPRNNCLIATGIGCGVLVLVCIAFAVIGSSFLNKQGIIKGLSEAPECKVKLVAIREALTGYQRDHQGKYPVKLSELIPNYLPDDSNFSFQQTGSSDIHRIVYTPPDKEAPTDAIVAEYETANFKLNFARIQEQTFYVRLLKNGRIVLDQLIRQDCP